MPVMVLVTYDVETTDDEGKRRLHRVAKACERVGQRVQKSVFECLVDPSQMAELRHKLSRIIDPNRDSLRFYSLGDNWHRRVEHIGAKPSLDPEGVLIL